MLKYEGKHVYLACGKTDMRKNINGLSALVESSFKLDPYTGALFVFCNGNRDRIKILEWDGDGYWLHLKRLEQGRYKWPEAIQDERVMELSENELAYLLGSPGLEQKLRRKQVIEKMVI